LMAGDLPTMEFRDWPIKLAVWQRTKKDQQRGREYTESSFTLSKTFKGKDGKYEQRDITLFPDDVLRLWHLLGQAYAFACVTAQVPQPKQGGKGGRR